MTMPAIEPLLMLSPLQDEGAKPEVIVLYTLDVEGVELRLVVLEDKLEDSEVDKELDVLISDWDEEETSMRESGLVVMMSSSTGMVDLVIGKQP